ncbi:hypothetical protein ANCCAN_11977 [Ancylostoma caninum]|uniref:Uncharacterized protein n=1 Tax=Ancylostoma caninum TaxID=29170 RepID=A0A368GCD2_ANCCA|nr:hypothetical protein ANCCAN_11977 [Ancylostoma caninum]
MEMQTGSRRICIGSAKFWRRNSARNEQPLLRFAATRCQRLDSTPWIHRAGEKINRKFLENQEQNLQ